MLQIAGDPLVQRILDSVTDGVLAFDRECRYTLWNPAMERISGVPASAVLGQNAFEVFPFLLETGEDHYFREALAGRPGTAKERRFDIPSSGRSGFFEAQYSPLHDPTGGVIGGIAIIRDVTSLREELRFSEQRFRALFEQSPLSTQVFTPEGVTTQVNPAYTRLLGVTVEMLDGYDILQDPQLDALGITPFLKRAVAGEAVAIPAARYEPKPELLKVPIPDAPPEIWVRAFAYPIKAANGEVREVVLVHEDVSATVAAHERVRASEERLRIALEAARLVVWDADLARGTLECTGNARELYGIDSGTPDDFKALIHPDDLARVERFESSDEYLVEYRLLGRDGEPDRWVQSRGRVERGPDHVVLRGRGVTVDITERKAREIATAVLADAGDTLNASLDATATLRELARVVVPRLADWCAVDLVNERGELERLTAVHSDPNRVSEANAVHETASPESTARAEIRRVIETQEPVFQPDLTREGVAGYAADARELFERFGLRARICVPLVVRGKGIGALTLAQAESRRRYSAVDLDIALDLARRAAVAVENAQLYARVREEDRRKGEFLATLAHELRNPLAPVRTGVDLLQKSAANAPAILEMMTRQIGHMTRLIDDLLDVSRASRGKIALRREMLDAAALVREAALVDAPVLEAAGVALSVRLPAEGPPLTIDGDATRLALVLSNLLNNAAKFTPRGGTVTLDLRRSGAELELRVSDTGVGISADMLGKVFEMFVQAGDDIGAHGGLGIGLTMVRRLVELHGGRVWAESDGEGKGSTFIVRLPLASAAAAVATAAASTAALTPPRRILIVDDNVDAARMLGVLLELDHHVVRRAASAAEAMEILRTFDAEVALLDIGLPGMSGLDLARQLRADEAHRHIKLVAVTGRGQADDLRRSREAGFDAHLTKPTEERDLVKVLASL